MRPFFLLLLCGLLAAAPAWAVSAKISWLDNSSNEQGFRIERARGSGNFAPVATVGPNITSYTDKGLVGGAAYRYRIYAYNDFGRSAYSNVVNHEVSAELARPEISSIPDQELALNSAATSVPIRFSGSDDDAVPVVVVASSSNPDLLPHPGVSGSGDSARTLTLKPVAGRTGIAVVTVAISNGHRISYRRFSVTVANPGEKASAAASAASSGRPASRLINVSARGTAGSGAETLVVGFNIADAEASILLRAVGPALEQFVGKDALPEPVLSLYEGNRMLDQSKRWSSTPLLAEAVASVGAFPLPESSLDAALMKTLPPGSYTAQVAAGSRKGIVLAEVYAVSGSGRGSGRLSNLSCRSVIKGGDGDLVIGFAVRGSSPLPVLIRAVGATLTEYGVTGAVANPRLTIYEGDKPIMTVDKWLLKPSLLDAGFAVGAFPLTHATDAAALVTLQPGTYSAVVSTSDRRGGTVLAELYEVP